MFYYCSTVHLRFLSASLFPCKLLVKVVHPSQRACMEGYRAFAPASSNTLLSSGPVLTAIVKIPAAIPACTPSGAFSMTTASLALTTLFESHQIGLGVWFTVFYVESCHHQFRVKCVGEIVLETVQ